MRREKSRVVASVIKCRLLMLKGKAQTARQLAEWINKNDFGISDGVTTMQIIGVLKSRKNSYSILRNVGIVEGHVKKYYIRED